MSMAIERLDWTIVRKPYNQSIAEMDNAEDMNFSAELDELDDFDDELDSMAKEFGAELPGSDEY